MKNVYAVASGEYSDYTVSMICTTKELAQQWVDKLNHDKDSWGSRYEIESFMLVDSTDKIEKVTRYTALLTDVLNHDTLGEPKLMVHTDWPWDSIELIGRRPTVSMWEWRRNHFNVRVVGRNEKSVIKACKDNAAMLLDRKDELIAEGNELAQVAQSGRSGLRTFK